MTEVHRTEINSDHQVQALALARSLRERMPPDDAMIVCCVAVAIMSVHTQAPAEMLDNALVMLAQLIKERGPVAKVVLDQLAEQMEPSGV